MGRRVLQKARYAFFAVMLGFMALLMCGSTDAGEVDILVEKLVQKGILTKEDAQDILKEVKEQARQERAAMVQETKEALKKEQPAIFADLPGWVRKMQLKGDLRLRYEWTERDETADRNRGRYRLRLGVVVPMSDDLEVGFGLASGSSDPRSTNETMDNSFERGDLRLDYAYASYRPWEWVTLTGGKFPNPLFMPSDLLFDTDIRPEGISAQFSYKLSRSIDLFMNTGLWVIDERKEDENDPRMWVLQPGARIGLGTRAYLKSAAAVYRFDNVKGTTLDYTSKSNTLRQFKNTLKYDYDAVALSGELGYKTPFARLPFAALYGDWVQNTAHGGANAGYLYGVKVGMEKVKKRHDWQACVRYEHLERDAWPDMLPDADTYEGETNVKGYKLMLVYGLFENVDFTGSYFNTKKITGSSLDEQKLQLDMNFRF
ncbi:MAG: putative porin [Desulfobacterota bacterium]|nr:putative porin [Thermodesulfobacteriota bacterium]